MTELFYNIWLKLASTGPYQCQPHGNSPLETRKHDIQEPANQLLVSTTSHSCPGPNSIHSAKPH